MGTCNDCWWLSDHKTGLCCNEKSEYNLCNVNMDNHCQHWSARDGSSKPDRPEWIPPYGRDNND